MNIGLIKLLNSNGYINSINLKALILLDLLIMAITGGLVVSATSENAADRCVLLRKYAPVKHL